MAGVRNMDVDEPVRKQLESRAQFATKKKGFSGNQHHIDVEISESSASTPLKTRKRVTAAGDEMSDKSGGRTKNQLQSLALASDSTPSKSLAEDTQSLIVKGTSQARKHSLQILKEDEDELGSSEVREFHRDKPGGHTKSLALASDGAPSKPFAQDTRSLIMKGTSQSHKHSLQIPKEEEDEPGSSEVRELSNVPVLCITDLSEITPRFALEGKVLNNYGTYKMSDPKFPMYFKVDIVDKHSSDTITVVVGESLIHQFTDKLPVGRFIRIEGAAIRRRNKGDGGSSGLSLHVDSTTIVQPATPFPVHLSFCAEFKIRQFLNEAAHGVARGAKFCFGTLAFVIVQSENLELKSGSTRGELIVADGPTPSDRATLTFVADRKDEYNALLKEIDSGKLVMRVARNVGAFVGREDTLSVMDLTVLVPVCSKQVRVELTKAFEGQVKSFGYGKEVTGILKFVNVNSVLIERVCCACKSNKVHKVTGGDYCVACGKKVEVVEIPKLQGQIRLYDSTVVHAQLTGDIVDRVLHLERSFHELYTRSVLEIREILAHTSRTGIFKLNVAGHVIAFTEKSM